METSAQAMNGFRSMSQPISMEFTDTLCPVRDFRISILNSHFANDAHDVVPLLFVNIFITQFYDA